MSQVAKNYTPDTSDFKDMGQKEMAAEVQHQALLSGYHGAFWFAVIISILSLISVFMLKSKRQIRLEEDKN